MKKQSNVNIPTTSIADRAMAAIGYAGLLWDDSISDSIIDVQFHDEFKWGQRDLNPHGLLRPTDFHSPAAFATACGISPQL